MARSRIYEMVLELQGRINSTFGGAFRSASSQFQLLEQRTRELRNSQRALDEAYSRGQLSMRDYQNRMRQLQEQLDRTAAAQRRLRDLLNQRANIQSQNEGLGEKAGSTAAMATPIIGAAVAAASYADAQKQIQIQNNLTAKQAENAWKVVRQAHLSGLGEGIQETSYAYGLMSQIIKGETAEQQKAILQGALAIEKYWQQDTAEISKTVQNMTANIQGMSKTEAMDIIVAGFKNGLNYADDYMDTLSEYAPQLDELGFSAKQFYSVLKAGKNAGAFNLDKVGDALKEFRSLATEESSAEAYTMLGFDPAQIAQQVSKGGETALSTLDEVIKKLRNITDPAQREIIGKDIFGTMWEDLTGDVILAMNVLEETGDEIDGAAKKVVDAATNAEDGSLSWVQLGRSIQDTAAAIGNSFLPVFLPMIQSLNNSAMAVAKFAEEHPGLTKVITTGAAGLIGLRLASIGARFGWNQLRLMGTDLRLVIEKLRNSQILTTAVTRGLTLAQKGLNRAMGMNPIMKVITLIGGLIGAGVYLYKNFDTVREYVNKLWDAFKEKFPGAAEFIEMVAKKVKGLWDKLKGFWRWLTGAGDDSSGGTGTNALGLARHATGGILTRPHVGMVAEEGPEAVIPLAQKRRQRAVELWQQTGQVLGVARHAEGGIWGGAGLSAAPEPLWQQAGKMLGDNIMVGGGDIVVNIHAPFTVNGSADTPALREQQRQYMAELKDTIKKVMQEIQHNNRRVAYV